MAEFNIDNIVSYRQGIVLKVHFCNLGCCHRSIEDGMVFNYIEMRDKDDNLFFAYEDQNMYKEYEANFHSKRFTSFNEFFTTEEIATDDKSGFPLKYYIRRPETDYIITSISDLQEKLEGLPDCEKKADRITHWGEYDKTVNYHYE